MRTKIIKYVRLWLVLMVFAMAAALRVEATIEVIDDWGSGIQKVDETHLQQEPNGTFVTGSVRVPGTITFYTPISGSTQYIRKRISIDCAYTNPIVNVSVDPVTGTIVARTVTGGDGNGIIATISNNPPDYTVISCETNPSIYFEPQADVDVIQVPETPGDYVVFGTSSTTSGSGSTETGTTTVAAIDLITGKLVFQTPLPGSFFGANGLGYETGITIPQSKLAKPAGIEADDVTSNDLSGITLYGTTSGGGTANDGVLYKINGDGTGFQILHNFGPGATNGIYPIGNVIFSSDGGTLYGTTETGGSSFGGTLYSISTNGTGYTNLYSFAGSYLYGDRPTGDLLLSGDTLYGVEGGGSNNDGVIFSIKTNGTVYTAMYNFSALSTTTNAAGLHTNIDGADPVSGLILSSNVLVGTTTEGGTDGYGTIFGFVLGPPIITGQPANQTADFGDTVVFNVGLDGPPPFGYQWQHNGTNLTDNYAASNPYLVNGYYGFNSSNQLGNYSVIVTNVYGAVTSSVANLSMDIVKDDGFANQFTGWTETGISQSSVTIGYPNVYGIYAAYLGENSTNLSYISQTLPTVTGQTYLLSFWLNTHDVYPPNEFLASWNGNTLFDQVNIPNGTNASPGQAAPATGWTNMQYTVVATGTNTVLQFGFQTGHSYDQFVLTGINLSPVTVATAPIPLNIQLSGNQVILNWTNPAFALQAAPIATGTYTNVPNATNSPYTNPITGPQTFFRLIH
jgi:uncharacterized repeat protein (TIGR03803 family)